MRYKGKRKYSGGKRGYKKKHYGKSKRKKNYYTSRGGIRM
jgi:hypothetical protein